MQEFPVQPASFKLSQQYIKLMLLERSIWAKNPTLFNFEHWFSGLWVICSSTTGSLLFSDLEMLISGLQRSLVLYWSLVSSDLSSLGCGPSTYSCLSTSSFDVALWMLCGCSSTFALWRFSGLWACHLWLLFEGSLRRGFKPALFSTYYCCCCSVLLISTYCSLLLLLLSAQNRAWYCSVTAKYGLL